MRESCVSVNEISEQSSRHCSSNLCCFSFRISAVPESDPSLTYGPVLPPAVVPPACHPGAASSRAAAVAAAARPTASAAAAVGAAATATPPTGATAAAHHGTRFSEPVVAARLPLHWGNAKNTGISESPSQRVTRRPMQRAAATGAFNSLCLHPSFWCLSKNVPAEVQSRLLVPHRPQEQRCHLFVRRAKHEKKHRSCIYPPNIPVPWYPFLKVCTLPANPDFTERTEPLRRCLVPVFADSFTAIFIGNKEEVYGSDLSTSQGGEQICFLWVGGQMPSRLPVSSNAKWIYPLIKWKQLKCHFLFYNTERLKQHFHGLRVCFR